LIIAGDEIMTERKKRQKVVAEISVAHLTEFAAGIGSALNHEEAIRFLNHAGHAYEMWKRMMEAGEAYIKTALQKESKFTLHSAQRHPEHRHIAV
jgi:hypothetical protein